MYSYEWVNAEQAFRKGRYAEAFAEYDKPKFRDTERYRGLIYALAGAGTSHGAQSELNARQRQPFDKWRCWSCLSEVAGVSRSSSKPWARRSSKPWFSCKS
jgi:hypothetical protein